MKSVLGGSGMISIGTDPYESQSIGPVWKESREPTCGSIGRMLVEPMRNPHSEYCQRVARMAARIVSTVGLVMVMFGCQGTDRALMVTSQHWESWQAGQVVDAKTGLPVPMNSWLETLASYDTIY